MHTHSHTPGLIYSHDAQADVLHSLMSVYALTQRLVYESITKRMSGYI